MKTRLTQEELKRLRTELNSVNGIDRETPRAISDDMAKGSNYKQIPFKNDEELKRGLK